MNKNILKVYLRGDKFFPLWLVIISFILPMTARYNVKLIMFISTLKVLDGFVSKNFRMFISLGCTRKKYYINTIKTSLINSLFLSIVCTILNFFGDGINNSKHILIIFLFYLTFYILFSSIEIFIEVLSISQYEALEIGMLFFYFILYIRFILLGPIFSWNTQWIVKEFVSYFWGSLAVICFNMFMTIIALKTTEI